MRLDDDRATAMRQSGDMTLRFGNARVMATVAGVPAHMCFSLRETEGATQPRKDERGRSMKKGDAR